MSQSRKMRSREFFRRMDQYLARMDDHLADGKQRDAEINEELRLSREAHEDLRQFIHDERALMYKQFAAFERRLERHDRLADARHQESQRTSAEMIERLVDMGDEIRANTRAVLSMLDRFNGGEATA